MSLMLGKREIEDPFENQFAFFEKKENGYGLYIYMYNTTPEGEEDEFDKVMPFEDMLKYLQSNPTKVFFFGPPVAYYKSNKDFRKAINKMGLKRYFTHKIPIFKKLKFKREQEKLLEN